MQTRQIPLCNLKSSCRRRWLRRDVSIGGRSLQLMKLIIAHSVITGLVVLLSDVGDAIDSLLVPGTLLRARRFWADFGEVRIASVENGSTGGRQTEEGGYGAASVRAKKMKTLTRCFLRSCDHIFANRRSHLVRIRVVDHVGI